MKLFLGIFLLIFGHPAYSKAAKQDITNRQNISNSVPFNSSEEICNDADDDDFDFQKKLQQQYFFTIRHFPFSNIPVVAAFELNRDKHVAGYLLDKICVLRL